MRVSRFRAIFVTTGMLLSSVGAWAQKEMAPLEFANWQPVTEEEKQLKSPRVEPDAGAEILFWHVHIVDQRMSDGDLQRNLYHYIRMKVFDEKGKQKAATIDLEYGDRSAILDVTGRTVKPDGSVLELQKTAIFQRDLVRAGRLRQKVTSFAMPGVEPGAIVEYRWRERLDDNRIMYVRLPMQRDFPIEKVTYYVKPLPGQYTSFHMNLVPFNCKLSAFKLENDGYNSTSAENIPAFHDEPFAPSKPNLEAWALLRYMQDDRREPDKYWNGVGKQRYGEMKAALKMNDELKAAVHEATASAKTDEEKVTSIVSWVRKNIRDLFSSDVTDAERGAVIAKMPKDRYRNAAEISKSGIGTDDEMNIVFAAMALEAGMDARPAFVADWGEVNFGPRLTDRYFLQNIAMAVKSGDTWRVYDVSRKMLQPGLLSWREEGVYALITDPSKPVFIQTPPSPPEASEEFRNASLELALDGSLDGSVAETFTGHRAEERRSEIQRQSDAKREEWLKDELGRLFPGAELSEVSIQNVDDSTKPLQFRYHLHADGFAQGTGKRMFFQPIAFKRAIASPFTASERRQPIQLRYAYHEIDHLVIKLPAGLELDSADSPGNIGFGNAGGYQLKITINKKARELTVDRDLVFGKNGALYFEAKDYPTIKKVFDEIQRRDSHSLALKEAQ